RETILRQFSLDNNESALSRLVAELGKSHTELTGNLQEKIDDVIREFSLDEENSALSRLVKNVEGAQKTITREFSLDNDNSALARLRKEVLEILEKHSQTNLSFQTEVKLALEKMVVQRAEAARSTRHGLFFEDVVCEFLQSESQKLGDVVTRTGNTTG